jgi:hypothetical protein
MLWVAFDGRNKRNYHDLFNLMLVQMAVKQVSANVVEYFVPIFLAKGKLEALSEEYRSVIAKYQEVGASDDEQSTQKERLSQSKDDLLDKGPQNKRENNSADKEEKTLQRFQVERDLAMMSDPPNILLFYEELVKQFGYIVLFSGIFPLASFMSYISNGIQIKSQIANLQYQRRFKAEVSNGIGSWLGRLENLSQLAIIVNCASVYFTSHVYQGLFVKYEER